MSDEEDESMSEGFSASEEEWQPGKQGRGGESSDDDDSDFEEVPTLNKAAARNNNTANAVKKDSKLSGVLKQHSKRRKPLGQSLRAKLYNKYRPPPKTFPSPSSGQNSPSASTSKGKSKNYQTPNEANDSDSDGSVNNYLVNPDDIDFQSTFYNNVRVSGGNDTESTTTKMSQTPVFDCSAGIKDISDSDSEDNNESSHEERGRDTATNYNFHALLENANSLEQIKHDLAKKAQTAMATTTTTAIDVNTLLALGENQRRRGADEEGDEEIVPRLSKTKSTRIKRHTKTRPTSTVDAGDTDDSDFEEVADPSNSQAEQSLAAGSHLEIHVEMENRRRRDRKKQTEQDLEMALRRKINRNLKDRQLLLHKASLLCQFGRTHYYNRLLNDTDIMKKVLPLLPSKNSYPSEKGTEIKYFMSLTTWFKTTINLTDSRMYPEHPRQKLKRKYLKERLIEQIQKKKACCKQDMIFIYVALLRGMGLQCRLVCNLQTLPLKPAQSDLLSLTLKREDDADKAKSKSTDKNPVKEEKSANENSKKKENKQKSEKKSNNVKKVSTEETEKIPRNRNSKLLKREFDGQEILVDSEESQLPLKRTTRLKNTANYNQTVTEESKIKLETLQKQQPPVIKSETELSKRTRGNKKINNEYIADKIKMEEKDLQDQKSTAYRVKNTNNKNTEEILNKTEKDSKVQESSTIKIQEMQQTRSTRAKQAAHAKKYIKDNGKELETVLLEPVATIKNINSNVADTQEKPMKEQEVEETNQVDNANSEPLIKRATRGRRNTQAGETNKMKIEATSQLVELTKVAQTDKAESVETQQPKTRQRKTIVPTEKRTTRSTKKLDLAEEHQECNVITVLKETQNIQVEKPTIIIDEEHITAAENPKRAMRCLPISSPKVKISTEFMQGKLYMNRISPEPKFAKCDNKRKPSPSKVVIKSDFLLASDISKKSLRSRNKDSPTTKLQIPQLDGADDELSMNSSKSLAKRPQLKKLNKSRSKEESDEDFQPTPPKQAKAPKPVPNRAVLSTDEEEYNEPQKKSPKKIKKATDIWVEVWSDREEQWVCVDIFTAKVDSVEAIRKSASSNMAYIYAFQNDLSIKDVTARYCVNWSTVVRKSRVEKVWLDAALNMYRGKATKRDVTEDQELRRIQEEKPLPTIIAEFKNHPLYALERHLLKFQAIYPPTAPTLGFVRNEAIYSRDCVHTLHSREIWHRMARVVKPREQAYKVVKARPKWDKMTQTVIKDQPLDIFGYWQTKKFEPPTAENGIVPRNEYGNVELFQECMLPKKCVHLKLPGLQRVCKKLGIDCANAVVGFDFHQGACHPEYDGFVICEEFQDTVVDAWNEDQIEQERKEKEKYETRVYGNWKKLIKGLIIRERLKNKYKY